MKFNKQINLLNYSFRNIQVYRTRTFTILLFVSFAIGILSAINIIREGLIEDSTQSLELAPDILVQGYDSGRITPITNSLVPIIEEMNGIRIVSPRVWGYLSAANNLYTLMGINISHIPVILGETTFDLQSGRNLTTDEDHPVCLIGSGVAKDSQATVGNWLLLTDINGKEMEFEIVGIFSLNSKIYNHDLILTDIQSARNFFEIDQNQSTDLGIWVDPNITPTEQTNLLRLIDESIDDIKILDKTSLRDLLHHSINERAGYFSIFWVVLLSAMLLFAFTISSAVSYDAKKEIGLLKSMGFSTTDILEIRVLEYAITGFIATSIGLVGAIIYDFYLGAPFLSDFMLGWTVLFPSFILPVKLSIEGIIIAYGLGILPLVIFTVIPAWRDAITDPEEVLRGL